MSVVSIVDELYKGVRMIGIKMRVWNNSMRNVQGI